MTVYVSAGGRVHHIWRECLPMSSHYHIEAVELSSLSMRACCKRCLKRLMREGWPK